MDRELIHAAEQDWRDQARARMLHADLMMTANKYPDEIKAVLLRVFSLRSVEDAATNSMILLNRIAVAAESAEERMIQHARELAQQRKRMDDIEMRLDKASKAFAELAQRFARLAAYKPATNEQPLPQVKR